MAAAGHGNVDCVDALVRAGADPHHAINNGQTAMELALTGAVRERLERAIASDVAMSAARARKARGRSRAALSSFAPEGGVEEQARRREAAAKSEAELLASLEAEPERPRTPCWGKGGGGKKKSRGEDGGRGHGGGGGCGRGSGGGGGGSRGGSGSGGAAGANAEVESQSTPPSTTPPAPAPLSGPLAGAVADGGATTARDDGAVAPLRELDAPLGTFLARLGLLQHLAVLVDEEMSLAVLRALSADDLHANLASMGINCGARCRIINGLRDIGDDADDDDDGGGGDASDIGGEAASAPGTTAAGSSTPAWFFQGFEDIS